LAAVPAVGMQIAELYGAQAGALSRKSTGGRGSMDIRFISSLTPDDENTFAPALLQAVGAVLDQFPIAYTLRIETTGAQIYQHTHPAFESPVTSSTARLPARNPNLVGRD
jgi:hypothetical protein